MTPDLAVDNDVLWKAAAYGLGLLFWPDEVGYRCIGVLGAARFVLRALILRSHFQKDRHEVQEELDSILAGAEILEPTEDELRFAAEIEVTAQRLALQLDAGESQLCAMTVIRQIPLLETGDKRAIRALDNLFDALSPLAPLRARVRCLEQIVLRIISDAERLREVSNAVCSEPTVDMTLSICFSCTSPTPVSHESAFEGLRSYITALRGAAPRVLCS
jgi:hypothetical protein